MTFRSYSHCVISARSRRSAHSRLCGHRLDAGEGMGRPDPGVRCALPDPHLMRVDCRLTLTSADAVRGCPPAARAIRRAASYPRLGALHRRPAQHPHCLNDADVAAICTACTRAAGRSSRSCSPALPPRWRLAGRSAAMSCGTSAGSCPATSWRRPISACRHAGQPAVPRRPPAGHGAAAARGRFPGGPLGGRRPIGYEAVQRYGQTSWQPPC